MLSLPMQELSRVRAWGAASFESFVESHYGP